MEQTTSESESSWTWRRYTTLASALHVLSTKSLTLLPPTSWEDKNDARVMEEFGKRSELGSVLALCLAGSAETYHHWKIFAPGSDGVCIVINREGLRTSLEKKPGVLARRVRYRSIEGVSTSPPRVPMLPFTKRVGFKAEKEFRLVYGTQEKGQESFRLPISLDSIVRVVVSPWLHPALFDSVRTALRNAADPDQVTVTRSTLINSITFQERIGISHPPEGSAIG